MSLHIYMSFEEEKKWGKLGQMRQWGEKTWTPLTLIVGLQGEN